MNKVNDRWEREEKSNKNIGARGGKSTMGIGIVDEKMERTEMTWEENWENWNKNVTKWPILIGYSIFYILNV